MRTIFIGLLIYIAMGSLQANPNQNSPLGMNTNEALEVDASLPFVDLFRLALPFDEARPWFTKGNVIFDNNGWPKNLNGGKAGTLKENILFFIKGRERYDMARVQK